MLHRWLGHICKAVLTLQSGTDFYAAVCQKPEIQRTIKWFASDLMYLILTDASSQHVNYVNASSVIFFSLDLFHSWVWPKAWLVLSEQRKEKRSENYVTLCRAQFNSQKSKN
ncbi:hypothetical protein ILYODFUR_038766 [Ilyodon furcidens]|uniref:Uncharacterized protein n=1 Tax=Ilyodon furcidens TaxID=33524 RepID=A0ABV0VKM1_9TELE